MLCDDLTTHFPSTGLQGREEEFFAAISKKYYSCNPLKLDVPPAPPASPAVQVEASRDVSRDTPVISFENAGKSTQVPLTSGSTADKPTSAMIPEQPKVPAGAASPFTSDKQKSSNISGTTRSIEKDYHKLLAEFYQKHNPQKVSEVGQTLEKYKVNSFSLIEYSLFTFSLNLIF